MSVPVKDAAAAKATKAVKDDRLHVVMAFGPGLQQYCDAARRMMPLAATAAARSTRHMTLHLFYSDVSVYEMARMSRSVCQFPDVEFDPVFLPEPSLTARLPGGKASKYLGAYASIRLVMHDLLKGVGKCVWIDTDVISLEDLNVFVMEAEEALSGTELCYAGVPDESDPSTVNTGVLFIDLGRIRKLASDGKLNSLSVDQGSDARIIDQDTVNSRGAARVDARWNRCDTQPADPKRPGALHFLGHYKFSLAGIHVNGCKALAELLPLVFGGELSLVPPGIPHPERQVEHKAGAVVRGCVAVVEEVKPVERLDVVFSSSRALLRKEMPVCMASMLCNSSVPIDFHLAYSDDAEGSEELEYLRRFASNAGKEYGSTFEAVPIPGPYLEEFSRVGDYLENAQWRNVCAFLFRHDFFPDVDVCLYGDCDTVFVSDPAGLVNWCRSRGLGKSTHMFGLRSFWREDFNYEFTFGVAAASFRMLRESGIDEELWKWLLYRNRFSYDIVIPRLWEAGLVSIGEIPGEWNVTTEHRRAFRDDKYWGADRYNYFYGVAHPTGGRAPIGYPDNGIKVYHYTLAKPHAKGVDENSCPGKSQWDKYANMARIMSE